MPGAVALVIDTAVISSPSTPRSTAATAADEMQCAHGYSGCIGVSPSGTQLRSRGVAGLPVRSALRIAVTGRHRLYVYFASNTAMNASAAAIETSACTRARSVRSSFDAASACCTTWFHVPGPVMNQKRATSVWLGVRTVLVSAPTSRISLRSRVQVSEVSDGGGPGRNSAPLAMTHGLHAPIVDPATAVVGTYTPGDVTG